MTPWLTRLSFLFFFTCLLISGARGQGGPPLHTDDPGTPGSGNWEINFGFTVDRQPQSHEYETPIVDFNFGAGNRVQLKFELPYVLVNTNGGPIRSGLGNSLFGVKWRFYESKKHSFSLSTYPQLEFSNPTASVRRDLVNGAPNFLLPLEVTKKVGPLDLNAEAGYWFNSYASGGHILGLAVGHRPTERLELLGEVYDQKQVRGTVRDSTGGIGGRYEFHKQLLLLFMVGRGFHGVASQQSRLIGYLGLQFQIERAPAAAVRP